MKLLGNICERIIFIKNFALCVHSLAHANNSRQNLQFKYDCHQIVNFVGVEKSFQGTRSAAKSKIVLVMKYVKFSQVDTLRVGGC